VLRHRTLTSWGVGLVLLLACASHARGQTAPPAPVPAALSEVQQCSVERVALQMQVVELRLQLVALQTQIDREARARERALLEGTLPIPAGQAWDWATLRMVPAVPAETEPR